MKRKRFSEEQIIRILKEAEQEHRTISEVCREHGVSENTFYRWRQKFAGLSVPELRRLRELERENAGLKRMGAGHMPIGADTGRGRGAPERMGKWDTAYSRSLGERAWTNSKSAFSDFVAALRTCATSSG